MDIFWTPDPHNNRCGSATLLFSPKPEPEFKPVSAILILWVVSMKGDGNLIVSLLP